MTNDSHPASPAGAQLTQTEQDFEAALYEIDSNLQVRRLMFVLSNVLIPALSVALFDALTGHGYPDALRWLPEHIITLVGGVLAAAGVLVSGILTRCHYGMVVNGNKLHYVQDDELTLRGLNWLGVTTNFVALTALYAGAGLALLLLSLGWTGAALPAGALLIVVLMGYLWLNHRRANALSQKLVAYWQPGPIPTALRERHARLSLEAATADISVIVVMAVALFAGMFNGMTSLGGLNATLSVTPDIDSLQRLGLPLLAGFTLSALLLSDRMVVRLRLALGKHAQTLADLREENDDPWRFNPRERTFLLYLLLHLLTSAAAVILVWGLFGQWAGLIAGATLMVVGAAWYPLRLLTARSRDSIS